TSLASRGLLAANLWTIIRRRSRIRFMRGASMKVETKAKVKVGVGDGGAEAAAHIPSEFEWDGLLAQTRALAPEAFSANQRILNLIGGEWQEPGYERPYKTPNDGTMLGALPFISYEIAQRAVEFAAREQAEWAQVDLDERRRRVTQC